MRTLRKNAGPAEQGEATALPPKESATPSFIDFATLRPRVPLCDRALREKIRKGVIPSVLLPGSRKRLFHWPSVQAALLRYTKEAR